MLRLLARLGLPAHRVPMLKVGERDECLGCWHTIMKTKGDGMKVGERDECLGCWHWYSINGGTWNSSVGERDECLGCWHAPGRLTWLT